MKSSVDEHAVGQIAEPETFRDPFYVLACALILSVGLLCGWFLGAQIFIDILGADLLGRLYCALLGLLAISLFMRLPARWLRDIFDELAVRLTVSRNVFSVTLVLILALAAGLFIRVMFRDVSGFAVYGSVCLSIGIVIVGLWLGVLRRPAPDRPILRSRSSGHLRLLDTSVIIDGRVFEVARLGFLEGALMVPGFVLGELQHLADQTDSTRRAKGRRGLEQLELAREHLQITISDVVSLRPKEGADEALVRLARELGASIVTNDTALARVASLRGVRTTGINELVAALKHRYAAGDELVLTIVKEGSQANQGVGYLEDGTMVVVEDGLSWRGSTVRVAVVSHIQTNLGRMMFARCIEVL